MNWNMVITKQKKYDKTLQYYSFCLFKYPIGQVYLLRLVTKVSQFCYKKLDKLIKNFEIVIVKKKQRGRNSKNKFIA